MGDHAPRYPSYDSDVEPYEERPAGHPIAPYQAGPAARSSHREQSVPLFLSDRDGDPDPSEYMTPPRKRGSFFTSRILAGTLACAAAGILAALVSSDAARDFIASAKASSTAALSVASAAMYPNNTAAPAQPKAQIPPKEFTQPLGANTDVQPARNVAIAAVTPTPADIKAAYQTALQGSAPPVVAAPVAPEVAIHRFDPAEIATLLKRAEGLIASGDIAAARLVLRRAAEAGDARSAMTLGGTYDPAVLEKLGVRGGVADLAMARNWYEKAKQFGAPDATSQLELLASRQR